jgi:plastocyanin
MSEYAVQFRFMRSRPIFAVLAVVCAACGGDSPSSTPNNPTNPYVITISPGGVVDPKELTVPPGSRVMFVNNHSRRHDMTSDPHPEHFDCDQLNQVGVLNPGQNRETGNLVAVRTCGFHDHDDPDNVNLRGSIVIR